MILLRLQCALHADGSASLCTGGPPSSDSWTGPLPSSFQSLTKSMMGA